MSLGENIKAARKAKKLNQTELGDLVGAAQNTISSWEGDFRTPDFDMVKKIAKVCGVSWHWLLGETVNPNDGGGLTDSAEFASSDVIGIKEAFTADFVPILGSARGGVEGIFEDNGSPLGQTMRPSILANVPGAYAVYVVGDSMEPRYFNGELVFINPKKPVSRGCFVIVQFDKGGERHYIIKQYLKKTESTLHLAQLSPDIDIEIPIDKVHSVHRVVGVLDG